LTARVSWLSSDYQKKNFHKLQTMDIAPDTGQSYQMG